MQPRARMRLPKAEKSLRALTRYIASKAGLKNMDRLSIRHSPEADELNSRKPRQFCHVYPRSFKINCTAQIESVSERVRLGLLLHEIGHIVQQAFHDKGDDSCEVTVDEWVTYNFPEAGYKFADAKYGSSVDGRLKIAKAIEQVSMRFANIVRGIK